MTSAFLFLFLSASLAAQNYVSIGRAYGLIKVNNQEWVSKEIHVGEDKEKNTYIQLGYGRVASGCILTKDQTRAFYSVLKECEKLVRSCRRERKEMTKDFGSISPTLSVQFVSKKHGAKTDLVLNMSGCSLYINDQQIRHMAWLIKDEKLTYRR
jgi:hypothetical protein